MSRDIVAPEIPHRLLVRILRPALAGLALVAPILCGAVMTSLSYRNHWNPHSWSLFPTWFPLQIVGLCVCYFTLKGRWWSRCLLSVVYLAFSIFLTFFTGIVIAAANGDTL